MLEKPGIIVQIEEKLGFSLKELKEDEILIAVRPWGNVCRGYSLNEQGKITGMRLDFCWFENIAALAATIKTLKYINLQGTWPRKSIAALLLHEHIVKNCTELNLNYTRLNDYAFLTELKGLSSLDLSSNNLTDVSFLADLKGLSSLYLSYNNLTDVSFLADLKGLSSLDLSYNNLTDVAFLTELKNLSSLDLDNNPITNPPKEIVDKGFNAIREYFDSLKLGEEFVYEAKLILVGEPGAGKTSLVKKLLDPSYELNPTEPMTKGIDIEQWYFPYSEEIQFRTNIWDFGGQEIMHATHRYFLTQRSLYIVLADNRKEDTDFYYWLRMVELLSGGSPVLVVLNEKYEYKKLIPQKLLDSFKCIKDLHTINLQGNRGLADLTDTIREHLAGLPHVGKVPVPKKWVDIRKVLEGLGKNHISLKEYFTLCREQGVDDVRKALFISQFLHDLGVVLHFQNDYLLKNCLILNPHWATEAVYLLLLDPAVIKQCGEFGNKDLDRVWSRDEYRFKHPDLLRLMINFELCYEIGNTQVYIIPELLGEQQPSAGYPAELTSLHKQGMLFFEYWYNFMPKGIITRLIVKMNRYIYNQLRWKNGVVLCYQSSYAEIVEEPFNRKIKIRLSGEGNKLFLEIIRKNIKEIHDSYQKLTPDEMVPCICDSCRKAEQPFFYRYRHLKKCVEKEIPAVLCEVSYENISVAGLLEGLEIKEKDRADRWDVFISYSTKDFDLVQTIIKDLKKNNIRYWLDDEQVNPGDRIIPQIENGILNSRYMMPCFSNNQVISQWSRFEYEAVLNNMLSSDASKKRVVPLIVDDLDADKLPLFVRGIRYVHMSDKKEYRKLFDLFRGP